MTLFVVVWLSLLALISFRPRNGKSIGGLYAAEREGTGGIVLVVFSNCQISHRWSLEVTSARF